jgi:hypothetical protein
VEKSQPATLADKGATPPVPEEYPKEHAPCCSGVAQNPSDQATIELMKLFAQLPEGFKQTLLGMARLLAAQSGNPKNEDDAK